MRASIEDSEPASDSTTLMATRRNLLLTAGLGLGLGLGFAGLIRT